MNFTINCGFLFSEADGGGPPGYDFYDQDVPDYTANGTYSSVSITIWQISFNTVENGKRKQKTFDLSVCFWFSGR